LKKLLLPSPLRNLDYGCIYHYNNNNVLGIGVASPEQNPRRIPIKLQCIKPKNRHLVRRGGALQRHPQKKRNKKVEPSPKDKIQQIGLPENEHPLEKLDLQQNISLT
jgi:hypothetical protein